MKNFILLSICLLFAVPCRARIITVDDDGPADFNSIQHAIDSANDGDTIIVQVGLYEEDINFLGKNITLTSTNPADPDIMKATMVGSDYGPGDLEAIVTFRGTEDANCALTGFSVNGYIRGCNPLIYPGIEKHTHATISHCLLSGNCGDWGTVIKWCDGIISNCVIADNNKCACAGFHWTITACHGLIKNCTIANSNNRDGIVVWNEETTTIENCILYDEGVFISGGATLNIAYSDVQAEFGFGEPYDGNLSWGPGNIDTDPCFVQVGSYSEGIVGDYHLQSTAGRWDPNQSQWVTDADTSDCIDAGNPGCPLGSEPNDPNNIRINMGAYGGTATASKSPENWALLADLTNDGTVDFNDFAYTATDWFVTADQQPDDLDRNGLIDWNDLALLTESWLKQTSWHE